MARADRRAALNQAISAIPSILSGGRLIVPAPAYRPVNLLPTRRDKQLTVIDGNGSVLVTERNPKTWYVSTRVPVLEKTVHYSRRSQTFASECAAKQFAAARIAEGAEVSAGTLNPVSPKRIVGPSEIEQWIAEKICKAAT